MSKFVITPIPSRRKTIGIKEETRFVPDKVMEVYPRKQSGEKPERNVNHLVKFTKKG